MDRRQLIKDYGTITPAATTRSEQDEIAIPALGDIEALEFEIASTAVIGGGAVGSGIKVSDSMVQVTLKDSTTEAIFDIRGKDFARLIKLLHPRGQAVTDAALATGSTVFNCLLPVRVSVAEQPAKLKIIVASIADLWSTAPTSHTMTLKVYGIFAEPVQKPTQRVKTFNFTGTVSQNSLSEAIQNAGMGKRVTKQAFFASDETSPEDASVTYVTFKSSARSEFEAITPTMLINEETFRDASAHLAGFFKLKVSPYTVSKLTALLVTLGTARTGNNFRTYLIVED